MVYHGLPKVVIAMNWNNVVSNIICQPYHKDLRIEKETIRHPINDGFNKSIGEPQGQTADFRKRLSDGRGIHIREYPLYYLVHWDLADPSDPIRHLIQDAPHWLVMIGVAALLGFALWFSESDE